MLKDTIFEKLTIKLSHFLTELDLSQNGLKLRLVDTGHKPASDIWVGLTERGLKNLKKYCNSNFSITNSSGPENVHLNCKSTNS